MMPKNSYNEDAADFAGWDDDFVDPDAVPEDGQRAWLSLLLISLIAGSSGLLLYAVLWAISV